MKKKQLTPQEEISKLKNELSNLERMYNHLKTINKNLSVVYLKLTLTKVQKELNDYLKQIDPQYEDCINLLKADREILATFNDILNI